VTTKIQAFTRAIASSDARGVALLVVLATITFVTAIGTALVMATSTEAAIAGNYRDAEQAAAAADTGFAFAIGELRSVPDWNALLAGSIRSGFLDGTSSGTRTLPGGSDIDLSALLNLANCAKRTACSGADMDRMTSDRPWGANNPRWQLYGHGRLALLIPALAGRPMGERYYVVVMVADDGGENDGEPAVDGVAPGNPGAGILAMRVEAFGPRGVHRRIDGTIARPVGAGEARMGLHILSWREFR